MASEILAIPEEDLQEVINIIRVGLEYGEDCLTKKPSKHVVRELNKWCNEEEAYLKKLKEE